MPLAMIIIYNGNKKIKNLEYKNTGCNIIIKHIGIIKIVAIYNNSIFCFCQSHNSPIKNNKIDRKLHIVQFTPDPKVPMVCKMKDGFTVDTGEASRKALKIMYGKDGTYNKTVTKPINVVAIIKRLVVLKSTSGNLPCLIINVPINTNDSWLINTMDIYK